MTKMLKVARLRDISIVVAGFFLMSVFFLSAALWYENYVLRSAAELANQRPELEQIFFHRYLYVGAMLLSFMSVLALWGLLFFYFRKNEDQLQIDIKYERESLHLYQQLLGIMDEGVMLVDEEGKVTYANASAHEILAREQVSIIGEVIQKVLPVQVVMTFFQGGEWQVGECQVSISARESMAGSKHNTDLINNAKAKHIRIVSFESCTINKMYCIRCKDVTENLELESQLSYRKNFDVLTQTMSRQSIESHISNVFMVGPSSTGLLFIDLDDFSVINQLKGYAVGDLVLQEVGKRLKSVCRKYGVVARIGSDEFVVFTDIQQRGTAVKKLANRVLSAISQSIVINGSVFKLNASIGIAMAQTSSHSPQELIQHAEKAMQKAKRAGGGQIAEIDAAAGNSEGRFLELGQEIRKAIKQDEFCVRYQPIFDLKHRGLLGFEALLRWDHKDRGLLAPAMFLEHLENSRMIIEVGFEIVKKSCRFIAHLNHQTHKPLQISVNLSPRQFTCRDLLPRLRQILMDTGCRPSWLVLEIPEAALLRNTDSAAETLRKIRQLGAKISIDDFGTGYSSLDYLKKLDVDYLKIDKSFVSNSQVHNEDRAILEFTTLLAKKLNLLVIAEGVEVPETDSLLQQLEVSAVQGYFYAKPMSEQRAEKFVTLHAGGGLMHRKKLATMAMESLPEKVIRFPARD